jgi:hypothetical protein
VVEEVLHRSELLPALPGNSSWGSGLILKVGIELTRGPPRVSSAHSFTVGVHIAARALHVLYLTWFGCIPLLSQWGGGGQFPLLNDFYLPSLA